MIVVINQSAVHNPQSAVALAMDIYHVRKKFPKDELYSLTTQIRKSSRHT
ncbi:MAG: four helix bundle protein [Bacteroidetes bacterium]|nr:four helix bundle protein [Bacteroidota bacterium]